MIQVIPNTVEEMAALVQHWINTSPIHKDRHKKLTHSQDIANLFHYERKAITNVLNGSLDMLGLAPNSMSYSSWYEDMGIIKTKKDVPPGIEVSRLNDMIFDAMYNKFPGLDDDDYDILRI